MSNEGGTDPVTYSYPMDSYGWEYGGFHASPGEEGAASTDGADLYFQSSGMQNLDSSGAWQLYRSVKGSLQAVTTSVSTESMNFFPGYILKMGWDGAIDSCVSGVCVRIEQVPVGNLRNSSLDRDVQGRLLLTWWSAPTSDRMILARTPSGWIPWAQGLGEPYPHLVWNGADWGMAPPVDRSGVSDGLMVRTPSDTSWRIFSEMHDTLILYSGNVDTLKMHAQSVHGFQGDLYVGLNLSGVFVFPGGQLPYRKIRGEIYGTGIPLFIDDGTHLFASTDNGVYQLSADKSGFNFIGPASGGPCHSLTIFQGYLYVGCANGFVLKKKLSAT